MNIIKYTLILLLGLGILSTSCKKKKSAEEGYLVFGHFFGECMGEECVETFKLEDGNLFEDIKDQYPNSKSAYNGDFSIKMSLEKFNKVNDLANHFPEKLWDENGVIGVPDAGDWGGIYVEYRKGEKCSFWLIDKTRTNIPEYLHDFATRIENAIQVINE